MKEFTASFLATCRRKIDLAAEVDDPSSEATNEH
jgi:hypothetical protein